ncbi:MAG: Brp/Blh family beta-carotene 15,15'-dioxygenase [Planctomycetota bacterium]
MSDAAAPIVARYTWGVGAATLLCIGALLALGEPTPGAAALVMVVSVALVGLPHGAYDLEVARRLFAPRYGRAWWACFGGAYLAITALAAGLWFVAPWVGLVALLVGGAIHWGADDLEAQTASRVERLWLAVSRGAVPVAAPMLFRPEDVAQIFGALVSNDAIDPAHVRLAGALWTALALPGLAWCIAKVHRDPCTTRTVVVRAVLEPLVLLAWFWVAPPILAFALYFCFWHSVRHSIRSAVHARPTSPITVALIAYLRAVALPTLLTWALALAIWIAWRADPLDPSTLWQLTFIGLFALTVPHVVLEVVEAGEERRTTVA